MELWGGGFGSAEEEESSSGLRSNHRPQALSLPPIDITTWRSNLAPIAQPTPPRLIYSACKFFVFPLCLIFLDFVGGGGRREHFLACTYMGKYKCPWGKINGGYFVVLLGWSPWEGSLVPSKTTQSPLDVGSDRRFFPRRACSCGPLQPSPLSVAGPPPPPPNSGSGSTGSALRARGGYRALLEGSGREPFAAGALARPPQDTSEKGRARRMRRRLLEALGGGEGLLPQPLRRHHQRGGRRRGRTAQAWAAPGGGGSGDPGGVWGWLGLGPVARGKHERGGGGREGRGGLLRGARKVGPDRCLAFFCLDGDLFRFFSLFFGKNK